MERERESPPSLKPRGRSGQKFTLSPLTRSASNLSVDTSPELERPSSELPSEPPTPGGGLADNGNKSSGGFHSTRSILNLTSSTLLGIYSPAGYDLIKDEPTPWGSGAQTPARREIEESFRSMFNPQKESERDKNIELVRSRAAEPSSQRQISTARYITSLVIRVMLLFGIGLVYGRLITQIHDKSIVPPVRLEAINRRSWTYLIFWGVTAIALGSLLPAIDELKAVKKQGSKKRTSSTAKRRSSSPETNRQVSLNLGAEWNPIVRSIGAFVGIAFAIRRLPWQSTFQVSLTLALANPVIWYLIDRTRDGFILSSLVGVVGSAVLLVINPTWVPSPAGRVNLPFISTTIPLTTSLGNMTIVGENTAASDDLFVGLVSYKSIGVATWIASVLFCSSVFFGNIGRRLILLSQPASTSSASSPK